MFESLIFKQLSYLYFAVKIPAPEIKNATYDTDEAVISIRYEHDYVKDPEFQVEFWADHSHMKEVTSDFCTLALQPCAANASDMNIFQ